MDKRITNLSNGQNVINEDYKQRLSIAEITIKELEVEKEEKAKEIKKLNNKIIKMKNKRKDEFKYNKNKLDLLSKSLI